MKIKSLSIILLLLIMTLPACGSGKGGEDVKVSNSLNSAEAAINSKTKTIKLTKAEFLKLVVNYEENPNEWKYLGDKPAIVDFYADWCGPCKMLAPVFQELAKDMDGTAKFVKVDVDNTQDIAARFQVSSIPTVAILKNGKEVDRIIGFMPKQAIEAKIKQYV